MSEITVVGLGLMGAALAGRLHHAGHDLTVWNRSPAKMRPWAEQGVATATDAVSALAASTVVIICIDNYAATAALLDAPGIGSLLPGRTIVQFSTGTPKEARDASQALRARGAAYLDGKLLCGPNDIGTDTACILLSGDRAAHDRVDAAMRHLDPRARYLGDDIGTAAAIDLAWLMTRYGHFIAIAHAARICQSEGASLADLIAVFPHDRLVQRCLNVIDTGRYAEHTASLAVWGAALERIREQGADAGIEARVPDFIADYFAKAIDAGFGDEHVMALFKVLEP